MMRKFCIRDNTDLSKLSKKKLLTRARLYKVQLLLLHSTIEGPLHEYGKELYIQKGDVPYALSELSSSLDWFSEVLLQAKYSWVLEWFKKAFKLSDVDLKNLKLIDEEDNAKI